MTESNDFDYSDLKAVFLNCTLKKSPELSHTQGLIDIAIGVMRANGVSVESLRVIDEPVATGVGLDMTGQGWDEDAWPGIQRKIMDANILVIATPIWLGQKGSISMQVVERLYGYSGELNNKGQASYYGRAGGCLVTGNEDGVKHVSIELLYSLQHIGFTIPPQASSGWIGAVGPGPSYLDEGSGGPENDFTNRSTTFMAWNLMHLARMLKDADGYPAWGNLPEEWEAGTNFDFPNPEYR